jgi:4-hydroxy-tetrahydrodipicolinate synthase
MFAGSMVALVTPMQENGAIDKKSLQELLSWHIKAKTTAIILAGSTGEAATLEHDEQFDLISFAVQYAAKRIPIIAGTGTNSTKKTIKLTENAKKAGADACLIVTPYYNKPPQKGLYQHYKLIADTVDIPIILYNVPTRTACDLLPETVIEIAKIKNIIGIKEATGNIDRAQKILQHCRKDFAIFSGDDATALDLMRNGATGVISVTANVAPEKMFNMCEAALGGDYALAEKINAELMPLHTRLFLEANPIPVKWALQQMEKISSGIRLPLLPLDVQYHQAVKKAMQSAGVLLHEIV